MGQSYIYMLASGKNGTLYIGVTSDIVKRIWQHKEKHGDGFSVKYNINTLVYYEIFDSIEEAIKKEKRMKKLYRWEKLKLIENFNPDWKDLYESIL